MIHGAGDSGWYWHLVASELEQRGHEVVAVDLPSDDESAGLWDQADAVVDAIGDRTDLVVVGQSSGGFIAPLVAARVPVDVLVFLTGMIPSPGETADEWWSNTGYKREPGTDDSTIALFYHDVPPELAAEALRRERPQAESAGGEPWPLEALPDVPTRFILCRDDRFFPAEWMRGVVRERLGITPDEIDGSHCVALSRPKDVADRLVAYHRDVGAGAS